ncbi:MAG: hypothetical protein HY791_24220 [Deltaproteobacteria bacterium]|nr:hypothetical protein [Deltaproteobacteria bacterium]
MSLTITPVNGAPRFTSTAPLAVAEDTELVYDAEAVDVEGGALTYALRASPPSMRLDATTGVIRWTPPNADVGVHTVSIEVTDAERLSAAQTFSIRVENRNDLPEFTSTPITRGYPGVQYSYLAKATDPDRNETALLRFAATAGPTGLTVDRVSGEVHAQCSHRYSDPRGEPLNSVLPSVDRLAGDGALVAAAQGQYLNANAAIRVHLGGTRGVRTYLKEGEPNRRIRPNELGGDALSSDPFGGGILSLQDAQAYEYQGLDFIQWLYGLRIRTP